MSWRLRSPVIRRSLKPNNETDGRREIDDIESLVRNIGGIGVAASGNPMTRRIWLILGVLLAMWILAACGTSKTHPRSRSASTSSTHAAAVPPATTDTPSRVGAPTPSGVTCNQTLSPGSSVESALASASPGSVVCLNSGSWSAITLSGIAPALPGVTLAASPGQTVAVPGFTVTGRNTRNLTIEGFDIRVPANVDESQGGNPNNGIQLLCGISGGVRLEYNTIENQPNGDGMYAFANNCSPHAGATQSGVTVDHNEIDHVGTALEIDGGLKAELNFDISHNVIGPSIQYGGYGHYVQIQGISGLRMNNNAFEGSPDPRYEDCEANGSASHLNVLHIDDGQRNVTFDNNIMWHVQTCGETVLIQNSPMDNIAIENNLDVEDPACNNNKSNGCPTEPFLVEAPHRLVFEHNTSVNAARGITLGYVSNADATYTDPHGMTAEYNIAVPTPGESGETNYGAWDCTSACSTRDNTSADTSADTVLGGAGNVVKWAPRWTVTAWTPVSGPGYEPPPSGYYRPTGLVIADAGYQGHIGP